MISHHRLAILGILVVFLAAALYGQARIGVDGTRFTLDGEPFDYCGVSFFNAIYNPTFNQSADARQEWLGKFRRYGINVLRVWAQWDNARGFVDACPTCTLYTPEGELHPERLTTLRTILAAAAEQGVVVELTLFSQESWRENIRLSDAAMERAATLLAAELRPHRNLTLQIWNEFSHHTVPLVKAIKAVDPERLVTSSPGFAGVLTGSAEETAVMDYLTPHTTRQRAGRPWDVGPAEIAYLVARYGKPVVDDEPARNGTASFGGPGERTYPEDHIVQILRVWKAGGYITYHHDMFQTGYGTPPIPPSGIPDPEFSSYHRRVFEFLALRERYRGAK